MSDTLEKDFFLNPDAALDEGFEIKKNMYKVQDIFDRAAGIERKLIALTETIPAEVRCNELIESCEASIRGIEKSDFAEYGERIERNIKTLEMESTQSVNSAIYKGAEWIDKNYVNSGQSTTYEMLWNTHNKGGLHYSTDPQWAEKQALEKQITDIYDNIPKDMLYYRIPLFAE